MDYRNSTHINRFAVWHSISLICLGPYTFMTIPILCMSRFVVIPKISINRLIQRKWRLQRRTPLVQHYTELTRLLKRWWWALQNWVQICIKQRLLRWEIVRPSCFSESVLQTWAIGSIRNEREEHSSLNNNNTIDTTITIYPTQSIHSFQQVVRLRPEQQESFNSCSPKVGLLYSMRLKKNS